MCRFFILGISTFILCLCWGCFPKSVKKSAELNYPWICYYGSFDNTKLKSDLKLAILDPDNIPNPKKIKNNNTLAIGYLSIGEAEEFRWYWKDIAGKKFVLERNPDWEGDYYIDPRSAHWRSFVINKIIPDILKKGYDGIFLDTIDTAEFLEWKNPGKYAGSVEAMTKFIEQIRRNYPNIIIISNNGFPLLEKIAGYINFALVEDLYTSYDFEKKIYLDQDPEITSLRVKTLQRISSKYNIKILTLDYCKLSNSEKISNIASISKAHGFYPYITEICLQKITDQYKEISHEKIDN